MYRIKKPQAYLTRGREGREDAKKGKDEMPVKSNTYLKRYSATDSDARDPTTPFLGSILVLTSVVMTFPLAIGLALLRIPIWVCFLAAAVCAPVLVILGYGVIIRMFKIHIWNVEIEDVIAPYVIIIVLAAAFLPLFLHIRHRTPSRKIHHSISRYR